MTEEGFVPSSIGFAYQDLLSNMYVSNVRNRLRQLNQPTDNDCKRWFWELVQNAKDSIVNDPTKNSVSIKVKITENTFSFSHNGSPFTAKAMLGLLYKYSEGKQNSTQSTGRFGTGFLTTHTISKIVSITGDIYGDEKNGDVVNGFTATMYRDGYEDEELLKGVEKMKKSIKYLKEPFGWTTYVYQIQTETGKQALEKGLSNVWENVGQTLVFCKEVSDITIDNKGHITKITREPVMTEGTMEIHTIVFNEDKKISKRRFLIGNYEEYNEKLTNRFGVERTLRIQYAIEFDNKKNIIRNKFASLYCVFPLVGSEAIQVPFMLNSPDFQPDSERETIYLNGTETNDATRKISDTGVNRMILLKTVDLYREFLNHLAQYNYKNLYIVGSGLKSIPSGKFFDRNWYSLYFINSMREVMGSMPFVETPFGLKTLYKNGGPTMFFPYINGNKKQIHSFYSIVAMLYPTKVCNEECLQPWLDNIWEGCGILTIQKLLHYISQYKSLSEMEKHYKSVDFKTALSNLIDLVFEIDKELLNKYPIIPNKNESFKRLDSPGLVSVVHVDNLLNKLLEKITGKWNENCIHECVQNENLTTSLHTDRVCEIINSEILKLREIKSKDIAGDEEFLKKVDLLVACCVDDQTKFGEGFINKRNFIYQNVFDWFDDIIPEKKLITNSFSEIVWDNLDLILIGILLRKIESTKEIEKIPVTINQFNDLLCYLHKNSTALVWNRYAIIPDQNGNFQKPEGMYTDGGVPDCLKCDNITAFGIDFKKILCNKKIKLPLPVMSLDDGCNKFAKLEPTNLYWENILYLFSIIPQEQAIHDRQKLYYDLSKCYLNNENPEVSLDVSSDILWKRYKFLLVKKIIERHNSFDNFFHYKSNLRLNDKTAFRMIEMYWTCYDLHSQEIYSKLHYSKKLPNQYGLFKNSNSLSFDQDNAKSVIEIQSTLYSGLMNSCIGMYIKYNNYSEYKDTLLLNGIKNINNSLKNTTLINICNNIDEMVESCYNNNRKQLFNNYKFKDAMTELFATEYIPSSLYFPKLSQETLLNDIEYSVIFSSEFKKSFFKLSKLLKKKELTVDGLINLVNQYNPKTEETK
ncbi:hypothetical protein, conserved [Entamoeba dispar SAW760]|uniref:Uncharacterized protein n=1 Tax=Entamoeba dispar (strain ATCC PRA-260 / SAW760) TaxID=370354 RepID=B0EUX2_ENTDS|nr:uncharacterized protein EDI_247920 [Entamoeba dispar SAW760]EDR21696.1 hypothetical protein, conserved [Entamoeba dispar SAW760]|eukprot:EDR21696.1 hypothetical protein, conserved [Entamoeba dispar SAW760]